MNKTGHYEVRCLVPSRLSFGLFWISTGRGQYGEEELSKELIESFNVPAINGAIYERDVKSRAETVADRLNVNEFTINLNQIKESI